MNKTRKQFLKMDNNQNISGLSSASASNKNMKQVNISQKSFQTNKQK